MGFIKNIGDDLFSVGDSNFKIKYENQDFIEKSQNRSIIDQIWYNNNSTDPRYELS